MFDFNKNSIDWLTGKGAFITSGTTPNVMTASWGLTGVLWGKKVMLVPIRESRFTKKFIDETGVFSVSVPFDKMAKELAFCGTKSGRNVDKVKELGLKTEKCEKIDTYFIKDADWVAECKVLAKVALTPDMLPEEILARWYNPQDMHTLYIAEIVKENA